MAATAWRLISLSGSPVNEWTFQGCRLPLDGARAASAISVRTISGSTGVSRNQRQAMRELTASKTSMACAPPYQLSMSLGRAAYVGRIQFRQSRVGANDLVLVDYPETKLQG